MPGNGFGFGGTSILSGGIASGLFNKSNGGRKGRFASIVRVKTEEN